MRLSGPDLGINELSLARADFTVRSVGEPAPDYQRVLYFGSTAAASALLAAACFPSAAVWLADPDHGVLERTDRLAARASLENLFVAQWCPHTTGHADLPRALDALVVGNSVELAGVGPLVENRMSSGALVAYRYPVLAGNAVLRPIRSLLGLVARQHGATVETVELAQALCAHLLEVGAFGAVSNDFVKSWVTSFSVADPIDAREELDGPLPLATSGEVSGRLSDVGLEFLASVRDVDDRDLDVPGDMRHLIAAASSRASREMLVDVAAQAMDRVDVFRLGRNSLTPQAKLAQLEEARFVGLIPADDRLPEELRSVVDAWLGMNRLAGEMLLPLAGSAAGWGLDRCLRLLVSYGFVHPVPAEMGPEALERCERLQAAFEWGSATYDTGSWPRVRVHSLAGCFLPVGGS